MATAAAAGALWISGLVLALTTGIALLDIRQQRIPNALNLALFGLYAGVAVLLGTSDLMRLANDFMLTSALAFAIFLSGALGGGDCKYLIALSPVVSFEVLAQIVPLAMLIFVSFKVLWHCGLALRHRKRPALSQIFRGKLPFIWALLPGLWFCMT